MKITEKSIPEVLYLKDERMVLRGFRKPGARFNRIVKEQQANQVGEHKEGSYRSEKKVVTAPVNPGIEIISQQEKRQQEKQRMVGKCGGKVQAQSGEKRAGHSTAGAGDAEKEAERTAGKPGQQMVGKDDRA